MSGTKREGTDNHGGVSSQVMKRKPGSKGLKFMAFK